MVPSLRAMPLLVMLPDWVKTILFGSSPIDQAHVDQWIDFSSLEIDNNIMKLYRPRRGFSPYFPPVEEAAISALKRALEALNPHLAHNTYLVGDTRPG
ncbi:unnamed protein product [Trifolium pratense]|uniref:Uncharacterized protein n=1 Tax=Trifolium pratense TaxID=57577 RepID=A0ACB0J928_TRIPR|nr:unnamed protein product [Trifolium pratense]